jgi:transposase-like protein
MKVSDQFTTQETDLYSPDEKKALKCPRCGSHTIRAFNVEQGGQARLKCLTCGNEFKTDVFKNPESSVKHGDMLGQPTGQPGPQYPVDPQLQTQIIGLMQQIAEATDPQQKQQLQQQLEQLLGGNPNAPQQPQVQQQVAPTYSMRAEPDRMSPVDQLRHDIISAAGLSRVSLDQNDRVNHIINDLVHENGTGVPHKGLQSNAYRVWVDEGASRLRDSIMGAEFDEAPDPDDTLENLFNIPEGGEDYYRSAHETPPDWFMIQLNEELTNEILRESGMLKGAPYPSDSYKNAPDHTPKGQKTWPKEVNAVYNACMREGNGKGDSKDEKESSCARIAWAQYKKTQKKDSKAAADKHTPGTRVQVEHPSNKGQKGSILKHRGVDSGTGEDTYDIQLDNGEKAEGLRGSDFKRIKSARIVNNDNLPDSTTNHFFGSMTFQAADPPGEAWKDRRAEDPNKWEQPEKIKDDYDPEAYDYNWDEPELESPACPLCHGDGVHMGDLGARSHYRCRDCGMQFSTTRDDESSRWAPDDPGDMFGQDKPNYLGSVNDLKEGSWYIVHGENYKVPDVVKVVKIDGGNVTAHFETDKEGQFPFHITADELDRYNFKPYERRSDPIEVDERAQHSASGWSVEARRNFSPKEQRELIDENLEARARNYDKLDLDGTHYQTRDVSYSLIDRDFLWQ